MEFEDGTSLTEVVVEYPIGHARRRDEGIPLLVEKYRENLARVFSKDQQAEILKISLDRKALEITEVNLFMDLFVKI